MPGDISSGCGRDWERQLSGSSSGGSGGQGAGEGRRGQGAEEVRGGRARNADSVDTELTGGYLGHGMGTLLHIAPLRSLAIIIVIMFYFDVSTDIKLDCH